MAVSMESIQEISTSFDLKAAGQTAGALPIGDATPFSFMAILSRISGVLEGSAVNSQDSVGTAGSMDDGGKLFETATVAVDFSATRPALMVAAGSSPEAASLKAVSDPPGWIKDLLKEENAALVYSEQTASEPPRIIGAVAAELEKTEAGPESKLRTVDHASPPETLSGGLEARMPKTGVNQSAAAEGACETTKNPLSDLRNRYVPASAASTETAAGASAGKIEGINKSMGKIPPLDAAIIDRLKGFMAGNGGNESAVEAQRNIANGKNSSATDAGATAMGPMTNAEAEFTGHDAAARAGQDQKGNQGSALKQNPAQAFAGLNEGGEREVVDVKILQAGTEKKLTLRPLPAASASAAAQTADAGEAASFSPHNASRGGELPSAPSFGQTEGDRPVADGKRNHVEGNKVPEASAFHDPESSAALKNAPLKNVVPQSGAAGTPKDARPVLGAEEIEHKAAVRADGSQPHHRGEQATAAGVNTIAGNDRKEIQLEPQAVIRQVTRGAEEALNKGVSRIRMELTPPRLGALDMDLTVSNDRVRMVILVDSQEIRNILQSNMDQLRSSLQQQGLKMEGVEVFLQDRSAGGHPGNLFGEPWGQPGSGNGGLFQQGRYPGGTNGAAHAADASAQSPEQARQETLNAVSGAGLSVFA